MRKKKKLSGDDRILDGRTSGRRGSLGPGRRDPLRISLVSLGCPKNLVDSEVIAGHLQSAGFEFVIEPVEADVAVVNTCGFVQDARDESIEAIHRICRAKESGQPRFVVVVGCLVQRDIKELQGLLPGVDAFLPISDYSGIPALLQTFEQGAAYDARKRIQGGQERDAQTDLGRALLTAPHVSYLRISEGCNHRCSFCAIPKIRGRLRSKPVEILLEEAGHLAALGVKEINLVAEDTTDYGRDLYGRSRLPELLEGLEKISGLRWIRLLYAYPSRVTDDLMNEMARSPKVVPYLDMPIQHISSRILKSMWRGTSPARIREVCAILREKIPGIALRTSVIVGFPGESGDEFESLVDFVQEIRFERLGAFLFSPEQGTAAFRLPNRVPEATALQRQERIMNVQFDIIEARNKSLVGAELEVIVDGVNADGTVLARTFADAPEIDCNVHIQTEKTLKAGDLLLVRVTGFDEYDLIASPCRSPGNPHRQ